MTKSNKDFEAFQQAWADYPTQDNEGYSPDRGGFKCGWFAALNYARAEGDKMEPWTKIKNKRGLEFWRDNKTGLLWSPPLKDKYTFDKAMEIKQASFVAELGKFKERVWGIPTRDEITVAISNGILGVIPGAESFWSASVFSYSRQSAWSFSESGGYVLFSNRYFGYGVRCVGRP